MKSIRLNNSDREDIVKGLLKPIQKEISEELKIFGDFISEIIKQEIGQKVWEFHILYPHALSVKKSLYLGDSSLFGGFGVKLVDYVIVNLTIDYIEGIFDLKDVLHQDKYFSSASKFLKKIDSLQKERRTLKNKCQCALEYINTSKQLEEQFPEAYKVFLELCKNKETSITKCDKIENLRAELSKFNRNENSDTSTINKGI